jgi:hypothetical protein
VVIHNLDIFCSRLGPTEADTTLVVDTNAVLTGTITFECFQSISGWYSHILNPPGKFKLSELPSHYRRDIQETLIADTSG